MNKEKLKQLHSDFKLASITMSKSQDEREIYYNLMKLLEALLEE
jgi:hypothetical protein